MSVIILGSGPAGLLAAHAARYCHGREPVIITNKVRSKIGGAQFLHRSIPGITGAGPDAMVEFIKAGDPQGYAKKIYGNPEAPTSWHSYEAGLHPVWSMERAYDRLLELYSSYIEIGEADHDMVSGFVNNGHTVISSVPLPALLPDGVDPTEVFTKQDVWIMYGKDVVSSMPDNVIFYDGHNMCEYYRKSRIFGVGGIEFPAPPSKEWGVKKAVHVVKPLWTSWEGPKGVTLVGRYGKWKKTELIHNAYEDVEAMDL